MRLSIYFIFLALTITNLSGQTYRVQNAIRSFEEQKYIEAHDQLNIAKEHPRSVLYAETWYYDVMIGLAILKDASSEADRYYWSMHVAEAYAKCAERDTTKEFTARIKGPLGSLRDQFRLESMIAFKNNDFDKFLIVNDVFLACSQALGENTSIQSYQMADLAKSQQNAELAIKYFESLINEGFQSQLATVNWISLLKVNKLDQSADSLLNAAEKRYESSDIAGLVEAFEAYEKGHYFTALKEIKEAQVNDPNNPTLHFMTGLINLKTDRIDAAINGFHKVEELGERSYLSNYQLGKYYLVDGKLNNDSDALTLSKFYLEACEQIEPDDVFLLGLLSELYVAMGDQRNQQRIDDLFNNQ